MKIQERVKDRKLQKRTQLGGHNKIQRFGQFREDFLQLLDIRVWILQESFDWFVGSKFTNILYFLW